MNVTETGDECIIDRGDIKCVIDKHTGKILNLEEILDKFDYNLEDVKIDVNAPVDFDEIIAEIDERRVLGFLLKCFKLYSQKECLKKYDALKQQMTREREEFYLMKDDVEQEAKKKLQSVIRNQSFIIEKLMGKLTRYKDIPPELLNSTGDDLKNFYRFMVTITREINDVFTRVLELNIFINNEIVPIIDEDMYLLEDRTKEFEEMTDDAIKLAEELQNKIRARKGFGLYKLVHEQYELMVGKIIAAIMTYATLIRTIYNLKHNHPANSPQVMQLRRRLSSQISDILSRMQSLSERNLDEEFENEKTNAIHQLAAIVYGIIGKGDEAAEEEGITTRTQETPPLAELIVLLQQYYTDRNRTTEQIFSLLRGIIETVTMLRPDTETEVQVDGKGLNGIYGTLTNLQLSLQRFLNDPNANPQKLRKEIELCKKTTKSLQETIDEQSEQFMQYELERESEIKKLKARLEESLGLITEMEEEKGNLQTELQDKQAQCDALSRDRDDLMARTNTLTAELEGIRGELEAVRVQITELTRAKEDLEKRLRTSEDKKARLKKSYQETLTSLDTALHKIRGLTEELEGIRGELDAQRDQKSTLINENKLLTANLAEISRMLHAKEAQVAELTSKIAELEEQLRQSDYEIALLNINLQEKVDEIKRVKDDNDVLMEVFTTRDDEYAILQKEQMELAMELAAAQKEVSDLREKQVELEKHAEALTKTNASITKQIAELETDYRCNEVANARSNKAISIILQQLHDKCELLSGSLDGKDVDFQFVNIDENGLNNTVRSQIKIIKNIYVLIAQYKNLAKERIQYLNHQLTEVKQIYNERLASMSSDILDREERINNLLNVLESIVTSSRSLINKFNALPGSTSTIISDDGNIDISKAPIDKITKESTELFKAVFNNVEQLMNEYKAMISASEEKERDRNDFVEKATENFALMRKLCIELIRADKDANEKIIDDLKKLLNNLREVYSEIDASVQQPDFTKLDDVDKFIKKLEDKGLLDLDVTGDVADKLEQVKQICNKSRETYSQMRKKFIRVYLQYVTTMVEFSQKSLVEAKERLSKKTAKLEEQRANVEQNKHKSELEIQRLNDELETLHANAEQNKHKSELEIQRLQKELEEQLANAEKNRLESEQEIQMLKDKLKRCRETNKKLSELNNVLNEQIEGYTQRETESQGKISELENQLAKITWTLNDLQSAKEVLDDEKQKHLQSIEELKAEIQKQEAIILKLNTQMKELRESNQSKDKELEELNWQKETVEFNNQSLNDALQRAGDVRTTLYEELYKKETELNALKSDKADLAELIDQAQQEKTNLEQRLRDSQKESKETIESYHSEIQALEAMIKSNKSKLSDMEAENQQLQRELDNSRGQRKKLSEKSEEQATMIAKIQQLIKEQEKALEQCKDDKDALTKETEEKQKADTARIATLTAENAKLSETVSNQEEKIKEQLAKMEKLTWSLQRSNKKSSDAQAKIQELDGVIEKLKANTESLEESNAAFAQNIEKLQKTLDEQVQEIASKDEQISKLSVDAATVQELREELQKEKEQLMKAAKTLDEQKSSICEPDAFAQLRAEIEKVKGLTYIRDPIDVSGTSTELTERIRFLMRYYENKLQRLNVKMFVPNDIIALLKGFTIDPLGEERKKALNTHSEYERKKIQYELDGDISGRLTRGIKQIIDLQIAVSDELSRFETSYGYNNNFEKKQYKNFLEAFNHFCTQLGNYRDDMELVSASALSESTKLASHIKSTLNGAKPRTQKTYEDLLALLKKQIRDQEKQFKTDLANLRSSTEPYKTYANELLSIIDTSDTTASMLMREKLGAVIARIPSKVKQRTFKKMSEYFLSMKMNCAWDRCNVMTGEFNRNMRRSGVNIPMCVPNPSHIFENKSVDPLKVARTMSNAFKSLGLNPLMSNKHVFGDKDSLLFYAMCLCKNKMLIRMLLGDAFKMHFVEEEKAMSFDTLLQTGMKIKPSILNMSVYNILKEDGLVEFFETDFMKQLLCCIPDQEFTTFCNSVFQVVSKTKTHKSALRRGKNFEGVARMLIPRTSQNPSPEGPTFIHRNTGTSDSVPTSPNTFSPINIDVSACDTASIPPKSIPIFDAVSCLETVFNDQKEEFTDLQKLTSSHALLVKHEDPKSSTGPIKGEFYGKECMFDISDACNVKISLLPEDKCEIIWETMMKKSNDVIKIFGKNVDGNIVLIPFVDYITAIILGLQHIRLGTLDVKNCDMVTFIARRNALLLTILIGTVTHLIRSNYNIENVEQLLSAREIIRTENEEMIYLETIDILTQDILSPTTDHTLSFADYDKGNGSILINKSICGEMEKSWNIMNAIASDSLRSSICSREHYRALSEQSDGYGRKMTAFTERGIMPMPMIAFGSVPLQPWNCGEAVTESFTPCSTVASLFFPHAYDYKALFRVGNFLSSSLQNFQNAKELEGIASNLLKELEFSAYLEAERLSDGEAIIKIDTKQFEASNTKLIGLFTVERSDTFKDLFETNKEAFEQTCVDLKNKEHRVEEKVAIGSSFDEYELDDTDVGKLLDATPKATQGRNPTATPKATPKATPTATPTATPKATQGRNPTATPKAKGMRIPGKLPPRKGGALTSSSNGYLWLIFIVALVLVLAVFVYMLAKNYTMTQEQFTPSPPISKNIAHVYTREAPLNYHFPVNHH